MVNSKKTPKPRAKKASQPVAIPTAVPADNTSERTTGEDTQATMDGSATSSTTQASSTPFPTAGNSEGRKDSNTTDRTTAGITQITDSKTDIDTGDVALCSAAVESSVGVAVLDSLLIAHAKLGESRHTCWERLRKEARAIGLPKGQGPGTAYGWATREVELLFPPQEPEPEPEPELEEPEPEPVVVEIPEPVEAPEPVPQPIPSDEGVPGLGTIPESWGQLAANASLQSEIAWVSANRLRVRDGSGVDLSRALSPAPSYSALSWLETSILFPSKFADISVKATANQEDEAQHVRREKMAIDEIRALLAEMMEE